MLQRTQHLRCLYFSALVWLCPIWAACQLSMSSKPFGLVEDPALPFWPHSPGDLSSLTARSSLFPAPQPWAPGTGTSCSSPTISRPLCLECIPVKWLTFFSQWDRPVSSGRWTRPLLGHPPPQHLFWGLPGYLLGLRGALSSVEGL